MTRVVVVGAGITGLATAYFLRRTGAEVVVVEAGDRAGGKIRTVTFDGVEVDVGADAYLARRPAVDALARQLGLGPRLVAPATGQVWLWIDGVLRPLPAGTVFGVPSELRALAASRVLSPAGYLRVLADAGRPSALGPSALDPSALPDTDVASAVGARVGDEVVERLVEPLLGGVYAGRPDRLSVAATIPPVAAARARGGSLVRALRAARAEAPEPTGPVFRTVAGGLGRLVDALEAAVGRVRYGVAAERIDRDAGGWVVTTSAGEHPADQVVVTTPAPVAARLMAPTSADVTARLGAWSYASVAVITLALPASVGQQLPAGSGMLVPRGEGRLMKAATWSSAKWPHLAGHGRFLVRCSVGRSDDARALALDDDALADRVEAELAAAVGAPTRAVARRVTRWHDALPQYEVGHLEAVTALRALLAEQAPGVHLAGAAYDGVGLAPCVEQARTVADAVMRGA